MSELGAIPDLLVRSDGSFARTQHRYRTIKVWIFAVFGSLYAVALAFCAADLTTTWHTGGWLSFWAGFLGIASGAIGIAKIALWKDSRAPYFALVADLRQAIRDGDEKAAAVVELPEAPIEVPGAEYEVLGPLRRPSAITLTAILWGIAVLVLLIPFVGVPLAIGAGNKQLTLLLASGLIPGLVLVVLGWHYVSPLVVRVETDGLRWRRPFGLVAFMPWRDAKSFFALTYAPPLWNNRETLYVLDAGAMSLAWRVDAPSRDRPVPPASSSRLCHVIAERTGLRLRDVTPAAKDIVRTVRSAQHEDAVASDGVRHSPATPKVARTEVGRRFRMLGVVLSPFLIVALAGLVAMLVQAPYYEHLYAQAHAHAPIYADALARADGDWPTTSFDHFTDGAYHVELSADSDYLTYVPAPHAYDHALVEVRGQTGGTFDLGGVGLAIVSKSKSVPALAFHVAPSGEWWIEREAEEPTYQADSYFMIGDLSAIHKGFGVSNQIAVAIDGSDFTFYVNGHYATGYHDKALAHGQVCLYLSSASDNGDFRDFAVYPL